ncbi:MAG TPA: SDR family NAD(P)-dependent oxidoreductase [Candidatus Limnocylindria bacterium]|nr:SDR family NAD(P)-dependent oxidoreductase [Candidatus Limnocylindria bacterium]
MGLDSVIILELTRAVEIRVGSTLPPTLLFEYTTVRDLARHLGVKYSSRFEAGPTAEPDALGTHGHVAAVNSCLPAEVPFPPTGEEFAAGDVAVIGLAGRYPGAADVREFWRNLVTGRDCVTEIPRERWDWHDWENLRSPSGKPISRWGGFIDSPECFDAAFFHISPREAAAMDPQERLFLEVCWSAIEDAGYTPETLAPLRGAHQRRDVGVFAGVMHQDYALLGAENAGSGQRQPMSLNFSSVANRVSYCGDFHGPSMAVDTACSSSLTAVHLAIESLRSGASKVALAGGVYLALHPLKYVTYGLMDMQSTDGRCRAFGEGGNGYVSGEGAGVVVLKPARQARADGDTIYAVIRGSSINHVGKSSGLTVPNPVAQADVIATAWAEAGIDPRTITCLEAHGTGTALGDPIEIEGLTRAFRQATSDVGFCSIGSVKTNIGHAEAAAGISGLTKLVLQLFHRTLVPSLHAQRENERLALHESPFVIQRVSAPWNPGSGPRRAGISSFGASGSNAHLVLEEAPEAPPAAAAPAPEVLTVVPLSARDPVQLRAVVIRLRDFLISEGGDRSLAEVTHTLRMGRRAMECRVALVVRSIPELVAQLGRIAAGESAGAGVYLGSSDISSSGKPQELPSPDDHIFENRCQAAARSWAGGAVLDWSALFPEAGIRRISLPTYPFAKTRHWLARPSAPRATVAEIPAARESAAAGETLYFAPHWEPRELAHSPGMTVSGGSPVTLFVVTENRVVLEAVRSSGMAVHAVALASDADPADFVEHSSVELFEYAQQCMKEATAAGHRIVVCAPYDGNGFPYLSLSGLLRSVAAEAVSIRTQLILDAALESGDVALFLQHLREELSAAGPSSEVIHAGPGRRMVFEPQEWMPPLVEAGNTRTRQGGVYWITGGLGGLGRMVARHLGRRFAARVILSGRSPLDDERSRLLAELRSEGVDAHYHPCDVVNEEAVESLVQQILRDHGALHGIIHSAGLIRDNYIARKSVEELRAVLAPKVRATTVIDRATRGVKLDFLVLFSSIASLGAVGQLDYAVGNAFLDAFAADRNRRVKAGGCSGHTVSINWPLWREGGMSPGAYYEAQMLTNHGLVSLPTQEGLSALDAALAADRDQVGVAHGHAVKLRKFLGIADSTAPDAVTPASANGPENRRPGKRMVDPLEAVLTGMEQIFGTDRASLRMDRELTELGADSVMLTELANHLNSACGCELQGAAFFELNTAARIVAHLRSLQVEPAEPASPQRADASSPAAECQAEPKTPAKAPAVSQGGAGPQKIAIIGYDGRFADAPGAETFWTNSLQKAVSTCKPTEAQWLERGLETGGAPEKAMEWAALLEDIAAFDAAFWGIEEAEAKSMDPQQRLLLRSLWRAAEHAGMPWSELTRRRVGLFTAADSAEYRTVLQRHSAAPDLRSGLSPGMLSNRLSYFCNFRGPSETVDTACSSVYVALNRAMQSLKAGECEIAFVAGVKILLDPDEFQIRQRGRLLSPDGRVCPFDAQARGYVRGEGVGAVILKPLEAARRDGDVIHAVVSGVGISHNGRRALSSLAPDVDAQCEALRSAFAMSGLDPASVGYIEANGAGTHFSDAAEMAAYRKFFKESLGSRYPAFRCALSAAKPNVGHLEGGSGLPSLLRAIVALREKTIPPTANFATPHPSMFLKDSPFRVPTEPEAWAPHRAEQSRVVGLHAIGIGGVNAHVLLEEPAPQDRVSSAEPATESGPALVALSAKTPSALRKAMLEWLAFAAAVDNGTRSASLHDVARRSRREREVMSTRAAFVVSSWESLYDSLMRAVQGNEPAAESGCWWTMQARCPNASQRPPAPAITAGQAFAELKEVAAQWVKGGYGVWSDAREGKRTASPGLPGYVFEERIFWCDDRACALPETEFTGGQKVSLENPLL